MTATPISNDSRDWEGFLRMAWHPGWKLQNLQKLIAQGSGFDFIKDWYAVENIDLHGFIVDSGEEYELYHAPELDASPVLYDALVAEMYDGPPWHILHPDIFKAAWKLHGHNPNAARDILTPINDLLLIRRLLSSQVHDGIDWIKIELPALKLKTVDLRFRDTVTREMYDHITFELKQDLIIPPGEDENGTYNMIEFADRSRFGLAEGADDRPTSVLDGNVMRILKTITGNINLYFMISTDMALATLEHNRDSLYEAMRISDTAHNFPSATKQLRALRKEEGSKVESALQSKRKIKMEGGYGGTVADLATMSAHDPTGWAYYYMCCTKDPTFPIPADNRAGMLMWATWSAPKMKYLLWYLFKIIRQPEYDAKKNKLPWDAHNKRRVLIFCDTPLNQQ
jgi:hypothetical protein